MTLSVATIVLRGDGVRERVAAANAAARAAGADILLFLPDDLVPAWDLAARVGRAHAGGAARVLIADVAPNPASDRLAWIRRTRSADAPPIDATDLAGQAFSLPAALFARAGGFGDDISWGPEVDLAFRLAADGAELGRHEGIGGESRRRLSAGEVVATRVDAGRGSAELYRRTPALLPQLELAAFHSAAPPGLELRRRLLAIGAPVVPPGLGRLLPTRSLRERWLRFQFEYHYWRGVRQVIRGPEWDALMRPPVILMYHAVAGTGEAARRYLVPLDRFRRQLRWLELRGYRVIGLRELVECRLAHRLAPPRSVVITFDDGYADNAELAAPVLRARGFPATVFVVSGSVGGRNGWDRDGELAGRPILDWDAARAMADAGIEIGAHTRTHPRLSDLPEHAALDEVAGSRGDLEAALGRPVRTFAYPFGVLNERVVAAVAASGFEAACCSRSGRNDPVVPPMRLRRVEVRGTDSLVDFAFSVHRGWTRRREA